MEFSTALNQLEVGAIISNQKISEIFKVSPQGGMRKSNLNHCLVLISKENGNLYPDKWDGDTLLYTGMGKNGDQSFTYSQNKTLFNSNDSDIKVFLLVQTAINRYTYYGQVKLTATPYMAQALDENKKLRQVAMFPITPINNLDQIHRTNNRIIKESHQQQSKRFKRQSTKQLVANISAHQVTNRGMISKRITTQTVYELNPVVKLLAQRLAHGTCQLCGQQAPFKVNNEPYLEVHYLQSLATGGQDTIQNAIALCPNCHQKINILNDTHDIAYLKQRAIELIQQIQA